MLDRNKRIKIRPERFQQTKEKFDVIVTCEERVYDQVIECKYLINVYISLKVVFTITLDIYSNWESLLIIHFFLALDLKSILL